MHSPILSRCDQYEFHSSNCTAKQLVAQFPLCVLESAPRSSMIQKTGHHMFKTKTLLVIILILGSAVAVKAGVFYNFGMPGTEYRWELADPMGLP